MKQKIIISLLIAFFVFAVSMAGYGSGVFNKPELYFYDTQAKLFRGDKTWNNKIKVILVDEAALKSMNEIAGRWPWPRAIWSDLLDFLSLGGARVVLFDILFLERQDQANDTALVKATRDFHQAYHSMLILREGADNLPQAGRPFPPDILERFALRNVSGAMSVKQGHENNDFTLPLSGLSQASKGLAVVEFTPDADNVYRRTKPLREYSGKYFPVLGFAPFIAPDTPVKITPDAIQINGRRIPVDAEGNYIINMYGQNNVEAYSMSAVFSSLQKIRQGEVENLLLSPDVFRDSVVFVGTSAIGTADLKAVPMGQGVPGVLLHAFLANNYLQNDFMSPPDRRATVISTFMAAFLTVWAVIFSRNFPLRIAVPLAMFCGYVVYALLSFKSNMQVEMMPFLFATAAGTFLSSGYLIFTEGAEKRKVSRLFAQYVSKEVLDEVLQNYEDYAKSGAGQKVEITVLFSDIRGFTTMSENAPPEQIVEMLNVHFTVMADIILKHNGTIDKYIGDAIMAFWGAPVKTDDHAERAVLAGKEMLAGLEEVNRILKERGFEHEIRIGVGINTGTATIGSIGSEIKKNYTVVGDTVNLSSRLESITKEQKVPLLFSEYTYEKIKDKIDCKRVGNVTVKGREHAVDIYTIS